MQVALLFSLLHTDSQNALVIEIIQVPSNNQKVYLSTLKYVTIHLITKNILTQVYKDSKFV